MNSGKFCPIRVAALSEYNHAQDLQSQIWLKSVQATEHAVVGHRDHSRNENGSRVLTNSSNAHFRKHWELP